MNLGDVFWADLADAAGHEQRGGRPVIVFQDERLLGKVPTVFVVPLTAAVAAVRFPATVRVTVASENGLSKDSVALVFQVRTIDRGFFGRRMGRVSGEVLSAVYTALDQVTGRPAGGTTA